MAAWKSTKPNISSGWKVDTCPGMSINASEREFHESHILAEEALQFLADLQRNFNSRRLELLRIRKDRADKLRDGARLDFLPETKHIRNESWQVAAIPADLQDRRVEITGPAEAKMMINALNCGAKTFMCDFEDSLSPTWSNVIRGQENLREAVQRSLTFLGESGKEYRLMPKIATLMVRPRGWHLVEKHLTCDDMPMSASLFDFGLAFFHNAREQIARGTGPYFYLPKCESHLEARLWNDVFAFAQKKLSIPVGTIKATVLIETITAAFEMDEILYELKDHVAGLNAGRWDYIFSIIKKFAHNPDCVFPDRVQVSMTTPFMDAYCRLLVQTCHKRGAHALGGMAAYIPSRRDEEANRLALQRVREDKDREAALGFDGTWIAHPDLVEVASAAFSDVLGDRPHQKQKPEKSEAVSSAELLNFSIPDGKITAKGVQLNVNVSLQYIDQWLKGNGAVALHNLMEDTATAEISRAQLWQWLHQRSVLEDGRALTSELYQQLRDEELGRLDNRGMPAAQQILDNLVFDQNFAEFLTLAAYDKLQT